MRALFWILLAGNLILFALLQWGEQLLVRERVAPEQRQLHEELIKLRQEAAQSAPLQAAVASDVEVAALTEAASAPVMPGSAALACYDWGEFTGADLVRAKSALAELKLDKKLSQSQVEHNIGFWVYMPPQSDKVKLNQKIAQLKARGITEYYIVQEEGKWQNAISLGVFKTRDAAQKFFDSLSTKDVHTARIGERASRIKVTVFKLNEVDEVAGTRLTALQQSFPGSELKKVDCVH